METKELENISNLSNEAEIEIDSFVQEKEKNIIHLFRNITKRFADIIFGLFGVFLVIPLTITIYICRKILKEYDGPIFYEQLRIGKNGKYFRLYKFRTMVVGADEKLKEYLEENEEARKEFKENHKLKNDPRITRLGRFLRKTSIDEMPQFWNVLRGEMSLIGPRPYLLSEKEDMGKYYDYIITCKPGITGLWQVSGRNGTTFEERLKIDIKYLKDNSLKNDVKIFIKTIIAVLKKDGAN